MKKAILLLIAAIVILSTGAVVITKKALPKVKSVSESPKIPSFIDGIMFKKKQSLFVYSKDSNSRDSRLSKLGFTKKSNGAIDSYLAKTLYTLMEVYDTIYPAHQFITFECVNELMKEYDLALGHPSAYIAHIPDFAIDSMERFKPSFLYSRSMWYPIHDDVTPMEDMAAEHGGFGNLGDYITETYEKITKGKGFLGKESDLVKYSKLDMEQRSNQASTIYLVLAPKEYFNQDDVNENGVFGAPKDPLVLAPVIGGYIIVCSW